MIIDSCVIRLSTFCISSFPVVFSPVLFFMKDFSRRARYSFPDGMHPKCRWLDKPVASWV